ncbi:MAG: WD40/YVTN/BNR-like repeat-containing protein [Thermoanaerobaculia bacterium]
MRVKRVVGAKIVGRKFLVFAAVILLWHAPLSAAAPGGKPGAPVPDEKKPADPYAELRYRFIGPPGNRVSAVVGVPGDPNTYYAGAASGGVWKSTNGGTRWKPIFDDQPAQSIGSIAIAPSDPNIVWVGTGEPFIRSDVSLGNGIYKSTDAGKTWTHMGLEKTGRIARVVIDPRNPDIVFAAAIGTCYGPQPERGVFRTTDGGKTWERVLFVDENTGASDLAMDPSNPRILFAGTWQIDIKTWGR